MPDAEGGGRNPFLRFLVHFKRCNKEKVCNLRLTQIVLSAGQKWKLMSCEEKSPYVQAARAAKYRFWTRSKDANRILRRLPQTEGGAEPQMQENFKLIGDLASWRRNVLDELLGVQDDGDKE
ncbi:uncharacterized protein LOC117892629 [Drosophila subobscura]|uniref:uncharacterized protein LOC117892629 n=1 Tax=Drosophila subobscura TaxID=7241 RepID=UPI00155A07DE|nr:uncharacterized protein LOC117892629 [Drosophila subobscura]